MTLAEPRQHSNLTRGHARDRAEQQNHQNQGDDSKPDEAQKAAATALASMTFALLESKMVMEVSPGEIPKKLPVPTIRDWSGAGCQVGFLDCESIMLAW